jgi:phage terminase small subunit
MAEMSRDEVVVALVKRGVAKDRAWRYAAEYVTYREADANIAQNGAVVAHPRTGAPLENPYLRIRDRARAALDRMRDISAAAAGLW